MNTNQTVNTTNSLAIIAEMNRNECNVYLRDHITLLTNCINQREAQYAVNIERLVQVDAQTERATNARSSIDPSLERLIHAANLEVSSYTEQARNLVVANQQLRAQVESAQRSIANLAQRIN